MLKVSFSIFQRAGTSHQGHEIVLIDGDIRHPGEVGDGAVGSVLPDLEDVHLEVEVGVVERRAVQITEAVAKALLIGEGGLGRLWRRRHPVEQKRMVALLGAEDELEIQRLQMADVRGVGGECVFDDDQLQVRMRAAHSGEQALGGVALAIVFLRPVGLEDGLGCERKHLLVVGMYQHRAKHLVVVGRGAVAVMLLGAVRTVDRLRGRSNRCRRARAGNAALCSSCTRL